MKKSAVFIILGVAALASVVAFPYVSHALKMRRVNVLAAEHINRMRSELVSLSRTHSVLQGIEQDNLESPASPHPTNVWSLFYYDKKLLPDQAICYLCFGRNTVWKEYYSCAGLAPTSAGICLHSVVSSFKNSLMNWGGIDAYWQLQNGSDELFISYKLELGENLKSLDAPIREILHRNLQALHDEVRNNGSWVSKEAWRSK